MKKKERRKSIKPDSKRGKIRRTINFSEENKVIITEDFLIYYNDNVKKESKNKTKLFFSAIILGLIYILSLWKKIDKYKTLQNQKET